MVGMTSAMTAPVELRECSSLFASTPGGLSDTELAEGLQTLGRLAARVEACRAQFIAEAERRGVARRRGFASTTAWLISLSGDPAAVCRSRLAVATSLQEMPRTRAARRRRDAGVAGQAPGRGACAGPGAVRPGRGPAGRRGRFRFFVPPALGAGRVAARHRPAGSGGRRATSLRPPRRACLRVVVGHGALRRRPGPGGRQRRPDRAALAVGRRGPRPRGQPHPGAVPGRCAGGDLPPPPRRRVPAGQPAASPDPHGALADSQGRGRGRGPGGRSGRGRGRPPPRLRRLRVCGDPERWNPAGAAGPERRVVPPALRRALDLRDGGCTHPGCDIPARWCDAHHIVHWAEGGSTEAPNLRLLCRRHHRQADDHQPYPRRP